MFKLIYSILLPKEKKQFLITIFLGFTSSIFQFLSIVLLVPYINYTLYGDTSFFQILPTSFSAFLSLQTSNYILVFISTIFLSVILINNILGFISNLKKNYFVFNLNYSLSVRLLTIYLNQDYEYFFSRNTNEISQEILDEINKVAQGYLLSLLQIINDFMTFAFLFSSMLIISLEITIFSSILLIMIYSLLNFTVRQRIYFLGKERFSSNKVRYKLVNEVFSSIKTSIVYGIKDLIISRFDHHSKIYSRSNIFTSINSIIPKYLIETIVFAGLILFLYQYTIQGNDLILIIPTASALIFAAYRIMPLIQSTYQSFNNIVFYEGSLKNISSSYLANIKNLSTHRTFSPHIKPVFENSVKYSNISFSYKGDRNTNIFQNLNFEIVKGSRIGIIGKSGSGKTTFIDLLMGLLTPTIGNIQIDGVPLNKNNIGHWQTEIGYVPQEIFLFDSSIEENICLAGKDKIIDYKKLYNATKLASLDGFIENELPMKYKTSIGEKGINLSGGQRQRIGIARALYRSPSILILDEATSALDETTEKIIINEVEKLSRDITVIFVTHRLQALTNFDIIYTLDKGIFSKFK